MGLSRTPSPPDRTTAVLGRFESLPNALIEQRRLTEPGISVPSGRTRVSWSGTILVSGLIQSQVELTGSNPAAFPFYQCLGDASYDPRQVAEENGCENRRLLAPLLFQPSRRSCSPLSCRCSKLSRTIYAGQ